MTLFVITGTSGVGKTYLEEKLNSDYNFCTPPKYTTRDLRPTELNQTRTVHIDLDEFNSYQGFFWTLDYAGNRYGWKKSDLPKESKIHSAISITIDSALEIIEKKIDAQIIFLHIAQDNLSLLRSRLEKRENFHNLNKNEQKIIELKINERLIKAEEEIIQVTKHFDKIKQYGGEVFEVKDDNTIPHEVIPWIVKNFL
jgi:guanylate kinase